MNRIRTALFPSLLLLSLAAFGGESSVKPEHSHYCGNGAAGDGLLACVVTDPVNKPLVVLDRQGKVVGASVEDNPFGLANRRFVVGESSHPYFADDTSNLAELKLPGGVNPGAVDLALRYKTALLDTDCAGTDYLTLVARDSSGNIQDLTPTGHLSGTHANIAWSDWADLVPGSGEFFVRFETDDRNNCLVRQSDGSQACVPCASPDCALGATQGYTGASLESFEYRLKDSSAPGFAWPRNVFAGHYYDSETELFENWHRYYDPSIGRYLQPEPLMMAPGTVAAMALSGTNLQAYAYAANNPLRYTDPDGNIPLDTIWDLGNVIYDVATGSWDDLALDLVAMAIPYVPAGASKAVKAVKAAKASKAAEGGATRFVNGVRVVDRRAGTVLEGTADLKPTVDRIASGGKFPHRNDGAIFQNRPLPGRTAPELPAQAPGYYREYVHPTPGVSGPGPQRIVVGQGGEMYYTPDHYQTFIPLQ